MLDELLSVLDFHQQMLLPVSSTVCLSNCLAKTNTHMLAINCGLNNELFAGHKNHLTQNMRAQQQGRHEVEVEAALAFTCSHTSDGQLVATCRGYKLRWPPCHGGAILQKVKCLTGG